MKLLAAGDPAEAARRAADVVAAVLRQPGRRTLVLSTGKTMVPIYRNLVRLHRGRRAPFARALVFQVDELLGPGAGRRSFRAFLERYLLDKVRVSRQRRRFFDGQTADPDAECARYERELKRAGGADLVILGLGANGHVAYLEPGRSLTPRTARVTLSAETRRGLAADGLKPPPRHALTMGVETILSARRILLVAFGRSKAKAVARALSGRVTPRCPASYLTLHPRLTIILDREAASKL